MFDQILANLSTVGNQLIILLGLTLIDMIFGILLAFRAGTFKLEKLAGYIDSDIFPILGWLGVVAMAAIPIEFIPEKYAIVAPQVVYASVFIKIGGSILGSIATTGALKTQLKSIGVEAKASLMRKSK